MVRGGHEGGAVNEGAAAENREAIRLPLIKR